MLRNAARRLDRKIWSCHPAC
ncbi:hypothetical protein [Rhabdochromatium marinum]|nr:hypothetical protein [Rhabdochromatium marinum]